MATYIQIASVTVGAGGASTASFSSIPSTYTDLVVLASVRNDGASGNDYGYMQLIFNGSTANYSARRILGYSTAANSGSGTILLTPQNTNAATANTFSNMEIYIPNYNSSNYKSLSINGVTENNATAAETAFCVTEAGLWSSTSALTSLGFQVYSGYGTTILQHSTFTLYGISKS